MTRDRRADERPVASKPDDPAPSKGAGREPGNGTDSPSVARLVGLMRELQSRQRERDAARKASAGSGQDGTEKGGHEKSGKEKGSASKSSEGKDAASEQPPAVQAGSHDQPENPLPRDQLSKPGDESRLTLAPRYKAPDYRGSGKLQDMVAIVTGGDSGIGRAVAVLFAREGADVAVIYLNEHDDARQTADDVRAEGREALTLAGDVRDPEWCREAVAQVVERFGRLDVLVNNAAFQLHAHDLSDLDPERVDLTLSINIQGYFNMARAAVPQLSKNGSIINSGSVVGFQGSKHLLDYAASKGAIHAFTKSLASNLLPDGIRVNAVAPGPVWTPLNPADRPPEEVEQFGAHSDMKRVAQPEEIAPAYVFLASPSCASYISGIVLPITGSVGAY